VARRTGIKENEFQSDGGPTLRSRGLWQRYGLAVVTVAACFLVKALLQDTTKESPFLIFFAGVMVSAWYGGAGPGFAALILSAALASAFFLPLAITADNSHGDIPLRLCLFLFEGAVICGLVGALHAARETLEGEYQREHRVAAAFQRAILQEFSRDEFPGLELATAYEPALAEAQVGGDFYDAFALDDGSIAVMVGDASGKGLDAATRTAEIKFALRAFLRECGDPARAVTRVNAFLCDAQRLDHRDSYGFVCVTVALIHPAGRQAQFVVAGMDLALIRRGNGTVEEVGIHAPPLGIAYDAPYSAAVSEMGEGDMLFLVTDGITEARDPSGAFLDLEGFKRLVAKTPPDGGCPGRLVGELVARAKQFAGGALQDDVCLLAVKMLR
jgi:serine phosphatase RsbU (regulator of sigma subunit)